MHSIIKLSGLALLALALIACPESDNDDENNYKVIFELQNESGKQIYAYEHANREIGCGRDEIKWLTVQRNDEPVQLQSDCALCSCNQQCALCDKDCSMVLPTASNTPLADGKNRRYEWDGRVWSFDATDQCLMPKTAAGKTFKAEICYGFEFLEDGESSHIVDPICETVEFKLDKPEQTVRVVVKPE